MEEETKKCPYCGEEILSVAIKCKFCGEFLNKQETINNAETDLEIECPYCSEKIKSNETICPHCNEILNGLNDIHKSDKNESNKKFNILYIILSVIIILSIFIIIVAVIIQNNSLPKCDSKYAEEVVLDIFKSNNPAYEKYMNNGELAYLSFEDPQPLDYKKDIKRYECKAKVVFHPNTVFDSQNYYKYSRINCFVDYSITKSKGKPLIYSSYCSNNYGLNYEE